MNADGFNDNRVNQHDIKSNKGYRFNTNRKGVTNLYYSESNEAKPALEEWYQNNIINKEYSNSVAVGNYYCEEAKVVAMDYYINSTDPDIKLYSNYIP